MAMNSSVRLQAYFTTQLYEHLREQSQRSGKSIAQIVREAVEQYLGAQAQERAQPSDALWTIPRRASKYRGSGSKDGAIHHDDYLYGRKGA